MKVSAFRCGSHIWIDVQRAAFEMDTFRQREEVCESTIGKNASSESLKSMAFRKIEESISLGSWSIPDLGWDEVFMVYFKSEEVAAGLVFISGVISRHGKIMRSVLPLLDQENNIRSWKQRWLSIGESKEFDISSEALRNL